MAMVAIVTPAAATPPPGVGIDGVDIPPALLVRVYADGGAPLQDDFALVTITAPGAREHQLGTVSIRADAGRDEILQDLEVEPCSIDGKDLPDATFTVRVVGDVYNGSQELRLGPDETKPTVKKIQSPPPAGSKVEKGDKIRFEVVGKEDLPGATWQTGVQALQVTGPQGVIKDKNAGRLPKACEDKSESLTITGKYKVRGGDPAVIEICGIADDYAANQGSSCAKYYKGEVWEGTFRQGIPGCTGVDEWTLEVVVEKDGSVTGNGTLTSPGVLCPDSVVASPGLTLQINGNRDRNGFHLKVVPCDCLPLDLRVAGKTAEGSAQDAPPVGSNYGATLTCKSCEK
ncbi:MAG: hypothetical protein ACT4PI_14255 [Actinomycetota bacterium]